MNEKDLKEFLEIKLQAHYAKLEANQTIIESKLDGINTHLEKLNSKVATHEKRLNDDVINRIETCPHTTTVKELDKNNVEIKAIKKFLYSALVVISIIFGIFAKFLFGGA